MQNSQYIIIKADPNFLDNIGSLRFYKGLFYYLVLRDIKVFYKQSVFGIGWTVLRPFITMIVLTVMFGKLAKLPTDNIPQPTFYYSGLVP